MWLIGSVLLFGLLVLFLWATCRKRRLGRWRKALALERHKPVFNKLYDDVNGFLISQTARIHQDAMEYVYGEIEFESFIALLSLCGINDKTVFGDLGSGTGKAVLACAMVFKVARSYGVELFPELHQAAQQQLCRLRQIPAYSHKARCITFTLGDFMNAPLGDTTLAFINATAFFGERWQAISKHLEQMKPDSLVISTSKAIQSDWFDLVHVTPVQMSWGISYAYIQRKQHALKRP
ncbi:class I SAM-dependent methyltransferase [Legionella spiritensis]|uniref:Histone-lysine N-methyltransferase, H3 lysine-79 specific n=1 Tax=Legionella spiritensis TaxID=452 RepID=A0A0W0ZAX1_LEGSP|nr:hypothetical protein [Legionella spiritensis]KTD66289.1 putative methyltransferase [Legionella spiritensis]SNV48495.1 putative methyltransferases [Legionella spiritensis]